MAEAEIKIFKYGTGLAITLSKEALCKAGFDVECHVEDGILVFRKKGAPTFKDRIQDFYRNGGNYSETEIFDDRSIGRELW